MRDAFEGILVGVIGFVIVLCIISMITWTITKRDKRLEVEAQSRVEIAKIKTDSEERERLETQRIKAEAVIEQLRAKVEGDRAIAEAKREIARAEAESSKNLANKDIRIAEIEAQSKKDNAIFVMAEKVMRQLSGIFYVVFFSMLALIFAVFFLIFHVVKSNRETMAMMVGGQFRHVPLSGSGRKALEMDIPNSRRLLEGAHHGR